MMLSFVNYSLLESTAKELKDKIGSRKFNALVKHPYYQNHIYNEPEDASFTHKTSPSGATEEIHASFKKKHVVFNLVGNKVTNAHLYHKDGDHFKHMHSHKNV